MNRRTRTLGRERSRSEKDQRFLRRTLHRSGPRISEEAAALITKIVNRYHDITYEDINGMFHYRYSFPLDDALDNYDYILSKIKNGRYRKLEHAALIDQAYLFAPELKCRIRTAPLALRRRAIVIVKLSTLLEESVMVNEECRSEAQHNHPSPQFIELGVKHWKQLDTLIDMVLDTEMTLGAIDSALEGELAAPLSIGAL